MNFNHTLTDEREIIFNMLFTAYYQELCRFAYQFVDDVDSARELTQEAFITLWEQGTPGRTTEEFRSFLHSVVKNNCLNHIKRRNLHDRYRQKIILDYAEQNIDEPDLLIEKELQQRIDQAILSLPEQCRKVFIMSRYENLKYKEIAQILGISNKAVEAHMSKALQKLRVELADYLPLIAVASLLSDL